MSATAWVRHIADWIASGGRHLLDDPGDPGVGFPLEAGAVLPISYSPSAIPSDALHVATTGSDTTGDGSVNTPYATLGKAVSMVAGAGRTIVVHGGTYAIGSTISITAAMTGLVITAAPGETPVFDGSIAAPLSTTEDGSLRYFDYVQIPAKAEAEGISLTNGAYPAASFDASGSPTGLAAERGFADVLSGTSYQVPSSQTLAAVSGSARVITGMYPDQAWVGDTALKQVFLKSLVREGFFWVDRGPANDESVGRPSRMYLYSTDAADMSRVRVSSSGGASSFIHIAADNTTLRGLTIRRHSPSIAFFTVSTAAGITGLKLEDVLIEDCTSIAIKLFGSYNGATFDASRLINSPLLRRVTVRRAGWVGLSAQYADDALITRCSFEKTNTHGEFNASPKSGAIKATKCHRMVIEYSAFLDSGAGHGVWLDQSDYDCTVASCVFIDSGGALLFWEIGHRLLVVNNLFVHNDDFGHCIRVGGGSDTWIVNNTLVGGMTTLYVVADVRGQYYSGTRPLSEHAERYGTGDYDADSPSGDASDLDKARPGLWHPTLDDTTPGMEWMAGAAAILNNVIAHYSSSVGTEAMGLYLRPRTSITNINVPPRDVLPSDALLFDGNIYQILGTRMARVDAKAGVPGGTVLMSNLSGWAGVNGLRSSGLYGSAAAPERYGREGTGWVDRSGRSGVRLAGVQGNAAPISAVDADMLDKISAYISPGLRKYGSVIVPPGGWV